MKKLNLTVIAMLLVVAMAVPAFANPFTDVPANHWAYEAINKLVAAGIVQGYPDGTYKGQNKMTRYEISVIVGRVLDNIAAERDYLSSKIDANKAGLSSAQAQDVTAIVKALMEKNQPAEVKIPEGLTDQQAEEVANLVEALSFEYQAELKLLGKDVDAVISDVDALEARVAALEAAEPVVSFSGEYSVDFTHQDVEGDVEHDVDYYWFDNQANVFGPHTGATPNDGTTKVEWDDDPYVYSDPWDEDSDKIEDLNGDKELEQTLNIVTHLNKDGFKADIDIDVEEDDDEYEIDSASLTLENDNVKISYNEENVVALRDYAFADEDELNAAVVDFKDYGVKAFFGEDDVKVGVASVDNAKVEKEVTYDKFKVKADVPKYKWNDKKKAFEKIEEKKKAPFYLYGAEKSFNIAGIDLNAAVAGRRAKDTDKDKDIKDAKKVNILGLDAAADLNGLALNLDFAYSMPEIGDEDMLVRFGAKKDLSIAGLEFNYKNSGEDFEPLYEDDVVFDAGDDDYDKFTTGVAKDTDGWNFTVRPHVLEEFNPSIFYASVDEKDVESTKLAFGAEYKFLADKATATFNYANEDVDVAAKEVEKTMELAAEYALNDYISADVSYENVKNVDNVDGDDKATTGFGVKVADYPVFIDGLTANAGVSYETVGEDYDEDTIKYNLGAGYTIGAAKLGYDYVHTNKEGNHFVEKDTPGEGDYDTHKFDLTYNLIGDTDLVASYEILKLDADNADYEVKTAKAGVSINF